MSSAPRVFLLLTVSWSHLGAQRLNEVSAGQVADRLLLDDRPRLVAPGVEDAIQRLGQLLVESSGNPERLQFTFTLLNDPVPDIFSFPGGYLYVTSGLLAVAESEDEVAAILAHEVAHVNAQNRTRVRLLNPFVGRRTQKAAVKTSKRADPVKTANEGLATAGSFESLAEGCVSAPFVCGAAAIVSFFDIETFNELWADELAIRYMRDAGFDTNALASIVSRFSAGWHQNLPEGKQKSGEERISNIRRILKDDAAAKVGR